MIFTRHLITCGLVFETAHVSDTDRLSFVYPDGAITIGGEPYSLVICPHSDIPENPWCVEGLRSTDEGEENEIWFVGTMTACIAEFKRITEMIRENGHQIIEPDGYDLAKEMREHQYHKYILDHSPWNLGE